MGSCHSEAATVLCRLRGVCAVRRIKSLFAVLGLNRTHAVRSQRKETRRGLKLK